MRKIIIITAIIYFSLISHGALLDRIIAYGEEDDIVITYSDLLLTRIQNRDKKATNREIVETLIKKEVLISYIKRTNLVKIRYEEVENYFNLVMEDKEYADLIERWGIDPLLVKMNLEKQLFIVKFIQHSFLASTMVTKDEIDRFIDQHPEYYDMELDDKLIDEIEAKIREEKIDTKIQDDIRHLLKNIYYVVDPDEIQL